MNSSRPSAPSARHQPPRRLSTQTIQSNLRRVSSYSVHSQGEYGPTTPASAGITGTEGLPDQNTITDEITEIKRYEDFTTIDWVQDAVHEQARRRARRRQGVRFWDKEGTLGWRRKVSESYDAGQAWVVITIVGAIIGLNSAVLNIITEWLADIKLGHCTTAFYLNESFCCWGAEDGKANSSTVRTAASDLGYRMSGVEEMELTGSYKLHHVFHLGCECLFQLSPHVYSSDDSQMFFAFLAAVLVNNLAPYAAGSGISEIKVIIAGFIMKGFLGTRTLIIKSITLPLAIASGLSVGKEGPSVHFAVCTGNVISRWFSKYKRSASKTREILTATAAAGVAVAFGSPIGGVLFSLEVRP